MKLMIKNSIVMLGLISGSLIAGELRPDALERYLSRAENMQVLQNVGLAAVGWGLNEPGDEAEDLGAIIKGAATLGLQLPVSAARAALEADRSWLVEFSGRLASSGLDSSLRRAFSLDEGVARAGSSRLICRILSLVIETPLNNLVNRWLKQHAPGADAMVGRRMMRITSALLINLLTTGIIGGLIIVATAQLGVDDDLLQESITSYLLLDTLLPLLVQIMAEIEGHHMARLLEAAKREVAAEAPVDDTEQLAVQGQNEVAGESAVAQEAIQAATPLTLQEENEVVGAELAALDELERERTAAVAVPA